MVTSTDTLLMHEALRAAWAYQILTFPNPAVGAVVSNESGKIIGIGAHHKAGEAHAEVLALKNAFIALTNDIFLQEINDATLIHDYLSAHHNNCFHNLSIHVTLEPCNHYGRTPPCSKLIQTLGLKRVVIGAYDESEKAKGGGAFLQGHGVAVEFGCLKEECDLLLAPFLASIAHKPFVFFKLAMSKNGVTTDGIITSLESRKKVHELRNYCDLMVIGGNTVRIDRPTLDARLCEGKAPNILIYSSKHEFDRTIPLFGIPERQVWIDDNLARMNEHSMVMVEGGKAMLNALQKEISWYLVFQSPHEKEGDVVTLPQGLRLVYSQPVGEDTMSWYYKDA